MRWMSLLLLLEPMQITTPGLCSALCASVYGGSSSLKHKWNRCMFYVFYMDGELDHMAFMERLSGN